MTIRFFEPDEEMLQWLRDYIGKRLPIDVGCGGGDFLRELKMKGIGIDPLFTGDMLDMLSNGIYILPRRGQECTLFLDGLGDRAIAIFNRPCHSTFVEETINILPINMEVLYITKLENIELYNDLGEYDTLKQILSHKGSSKENEVVYSIKRNGKQIKSRKSHSRHRHLGELSF